MEIGELDDRHGRLDVAAHRGAVDVHLGAKGRRLIQADVHARLPAQRAHERLACGRAALAREERADPVRVLRWIARDAAAVGRHERRDVALGHRRDLRLDLLPLERLDGRAASGGFRRQQLARDELVELLFLQIVDLGLEGREVLAERFPQVGGRDGLPVHRRDNLVGPRGPGVTAGLPCLRRAAARRHHHRRQHAAHTIGLLARALLTGIEHNYMLGPFASRRSHA